MIGKIYKISNDINSMLYIGKTKRSLKVRFNQHKNSKYLIGRAIRKYGEEHFKIELIEECETEEELNAREMYWIKTLNTKTPNGYNLTDGGEGILNPSEKTREKISKASMGNKSCTGRKHTEDEIERIRQSNLGQKRSPETCEKIRQNKTGLKASEETKKKMSDKRKGRKFSEEHKKRISEARKKYWASIAPEDRKLSAERRAQISAQFSGKNNPACKPENAEKIKAGLKRHYDKKRVAKENLEAAATVDRFKHLMEDVFTLF